MKQSVKEWIKCKKKVLYPTISFVAELAFVISSAFLATNEFFGWPIINRNRFLAIMGYIWVVSLVLKILLFCCSRVTYRKFERIELSERLSSAMLKVEQRANAYKTRHVLQITYGSIPIWHPLDYYENVLVYDVHEQIRTILLELKEAIITTTPGLDDDEVTVDLVYCYPDEDFDGNLPTDKKEVEKWRLITSRDGSSMNYKVHDFLTNRESFYFLLDQNN